MSIQTIAIFAIITIAAVIILPKVIVQTSSTSNATMSSDTIEKLFEKSHPSMTMAVGGGAHANNYRARLFVYKHQRLIMLSTV